MIHRGSSIPVDITDVHRLPIERRASGQYNPAVDEFIPGRNQDASATIRGFVYQVELTILRWLQLGDDQVLQLERGEDIDHITRAAAASPTETVRLLEQVKDVQRSLTLHAPGAVIAVASFCAHRRSNPGRDVRFRYTTTAHVGREKLSPLPKGTNGVEAWEQLRQGIKDEQAKASLLTGVRALLRSAKRPPDTPDALWTEYTGFSSGATDGEVLAVIERFEWSFGEPGVSDLADVVVRAIQARGTYQQDANLLHDVLFAAVFRTLSQCGLKELTRPDLESYLASPKLAESDRVLLVQLKEGILGHSIRLFAIEGRVEVLEIEQRALRAAIEDAGASPQVGDAMPLTVLKEAPLVRSLVQRTQTVKRLSAEAETATWIALSGAASTGKSHLAGLLATHLGGPLRWFALRGLETRRALDRVHATMSDGKIAAAVAAWIATLPTASVLVFDDLGLLRAGSGEATTWLDVIQACKRAGVRLITTGDKAPSPALIEMLGQGDVSSTAIPMFDDGEVRELLAARGAPSEFLTDGRVTMLRGLTGGHPALLRAAADYFDQQGWRFDQSVLNQLLAGGHAQGLTVETSRRVVETITLEGCRELLYRLCVIHDAVTQDDIRQTALVEPARNAYLECVQNLEGLWLQPAGAGRYEVSPLVLTFGAQQLRTEVAARVNRFAARRLLSRKAIDPFEFMRAIAHMMGAGDYNQAIGLMLRELASRRSAKAFGPDWPLIFFPPDHALPPTLMPGLGMSLRSHQVVAACRLGADSSAYWRSLMMLMRGVVKQDEWGVLLAANQLLTAGSLLPMQPIIEAARQLERIGGRATMPSGEQIETPGWDQGVNLWLVTPVIKNWAEFWMWVELLEAVSDQRFQRVMVSSEAVNFMQAVVDRLWIAAAEVHAGGGSVTDTLQQLRRLEEWAILHKADLITACAIRGQMVIAGEYENRHDDMDAFARRGLQLIAEAGPARALIELTYGEQLEFAGKHLSAIPHLQEAAREEQGQSSLNRVAALLAATEAAFAIGQPSTDFAEAALQVFESQNHRDPRLKARLLAEVATVRWFAGHRPLAFDAIESAVATVLDAQPTESIQSLTIRIGHALGYFATIAATGSPPKGTGSGDAYLPPTPSMFRGHNTAVLTMHRERTGSAMLKSILSILAFRTERQERSQIWAESAFAEATEAGVPATTLSVASTVLDTQVRSGDMAAAIETAFVAARAMRAMNAEREAGRDPSRDDFRIDLRPGPPMAAEDLDYSALQFVLVPMVLQICEESARSADAGRGAAQNAIDGIASLGRQLLSSDKWEAMRGLMKRLVDGADERVVVSEVQRISREHEGMVQLGAYLLLSTWPNADFSRSATLQVNVASFAFKIASVSAPGTPERLAEFLWSLWNGRLQSAPFRFGSPSMLVRDLNDARSISSPESRARATLRSVVRSLGVRLQASAREWLDCAGDESPTA